MTVEKLKDMLSDAIVRMEAIVENGNPQERARAAEALSQLSETYLELSSNSKPLTLVKHAERERKGDQDDESGGL